MTWHDHEDPTRFRFAGICLGDTKDLAHAAAVFHGWTGDTAAHNGSSFTGGRDWFWDQGVTAGIDPAGGTIEGRNVDGVLPQS